jgi:hypothetical protein
VKAARALLLACALALAVSGSAAAKTSPDFQGNTRQIFPVYVVHGLTIGDLPQLANEGAVGLLVPNAGPRTSQAAAFAGMVRGVLYNTRLARPRDAVLIRVKQASEIPATGPAIVVGLPPATSAPNDRRYPIAVIGFGFQGVLTSSLTRVPGLVSIADVARTALQTPHALGWKADGGSVATLYRLEEHIEVARDSTMAGSVLVLTLLIAFALLFPRGAPSAMGAALAANLALGFLPGGDAAPRVALLGVCTVAGGILGASFLRRKTLLGFALVSVLVAYAVTMLVQPSALSLAPIGPELTSRFYGVSNVLESLLLVPALLGARLLAARFGPLAFAAVALLSLATIAENKLGADGGGAVVIGVAFALLAVQMSGARRRFAIPALGASALVVLALVNLDAASSGPDHLRGALRGGLDGLANVAANRVPLAYARMIEQWWLIFPLLGGALVLLAVIRTARTRHDRAVAAAMLGALAASLLVNDSPGPVAIAGLAAVLSIDGGLVHRALALPVLRRLAPPVAAALPQEP